MRDERDCFEPPVSLWTVWRCGSFYAHRLFIGVALFKGEEGRTDGHVTCGEWRLLRLFSLRIQVALCPCHLNIMFRPYVQRGSTGSGGGGGAL